MNINAAEYFSHSTVRIECNRFDGGISTGTGFFYNLNDSGGTHVPVIVTNKHVVENSFQINFHFTRQNKDGSPDVGNLVPFSMGGTMQQWIPHPDDNIDLCVIPIGRLLKNFENNNPDAPERRIYFSPLNKNFLPDEDEINELLGLNSIVMVGYPNGLWDEKNNLPVFRSGILASSYKTDWNGRKEFLIDAACFPGSSGSPVFIYDPSFHMINGDHVIRSKILLLGVLYGGPQHTAEGEIIILPIATQSRQISLSHIPNNLGFVIKSEQLLAFEDIFANN